MQGIELPVVIAALDDDPIALRALHAEGIDPEVVLMEDETSYGDLYARLWSEGRGFMVVEHDIVPWPGALRRLVNCRHPWCGYPYPLSVRGYIGGSIGCVRYSTKLVSQHPECAARLAGCSWRQLDGEITSMVERAVGFLADKRLGFHPHSPAVAHAKALEGWNAPT